jgi:4-alpha-glucanotransferase
LKLALLRELAGLYSIQVTYEDATGKKRKASKESLVAALRMRLPEGADLGDALRARKRAFWSRLTEPVTVVWGKRAIALDLRLPRTAADASLEWELRLEEGDIRRGVLPLASIPAIWEEDDFIGKTIAIREPLPNGYHVLALKAGEITAETFIIAAPTKARGPKTRAWGVFVPLYAMRTERSWGAGDLGDMAAYRAWINEMGGGVVATLPMLAAFEDEPSPYSPVSRLFWNELYLDVERLPEFEPRDIDPVAIGDLQNATRVDYAGVSREKRRALERMARRFRRDDEFESWARKGPYGYAHFRAAKEERESADYHLYVQYRMAQQMREVADDAKKSGVGLYLDFPLGVNPGGFDAWKYGSVFAKGVSVGSPPDVFFTKGQNWGFPPFDPDAIREERYAYFRACIRHHVSHAGIMRVDHVMGLHRLFWIPVGGEAKDGVYVRYAEEEMYAILVLEASRHGCAIVGEDLGTVPQYVPRMMNKHGLRRMYVVQYEVNPETDQPIGTPPDASVASINTHDMPTFAGFWGGRDIDDRVEQGLLDTKGARDESEKREQIRAAVITFLKARGLLQEASDDATAVLEALLSFLAASAAEIVLVNLEDLWLEASPQNVPGVPDRSWRQKFRYTLDQTRQNPAVTRILGMVNERRRVDGNQR